MMHLGIRVGVVLKVGVASGLFATPLLNLSTPMQGAEES